MRNKDGQRDKWGTKERADYNYGGAASNQPRRHKFNGDMQQWELMDPDHGDVTSVGKKVIQNMTVQEVNKTHKAKIVTCEDAEDSSESAFIVKDDVKNVTMYDMLCAPKL